MISKIVEIVKATNGDVLGVLLFIMLLVYLFSSDPSFEFRMLLIIGCSLALIVDGVIVVRTILRLQNQHHTAERND
jgi:hypothetical protein